MQRDRESSGHSIPTSSFDSIFDSFGSHRSMMSSIFGGRDPFDDPFFSRPFGSLSGFNNFGSGGPFGDSPWISRLKAPVIEELVTSDEEEQDEEECLDRSARDAKDKAQKSKDPIVEHPDDEDNEESSKDVSYRTDLNKVQGTKPQSQSFSFQKVTYGGVNGNYYTATTTRKTGSEGVVMEESKHADRTTGHASHRISRGLHDKGHSVTRKLKPDGKVDTLQTLHNLNEDDLTVFEEAWKGKVPGWNHGPNFQWNGGASGSGQSTRAGSAGWALPSVDNSGRTAGMGSNNEARTNSYGGRAKKVVTINIE